jgi:hypothetical protein
MHQMKAGMRKIAMSHQGAMLCTETRGGMPLVSSCMGSALGRLMRCAVPGDAFFGDAYRAAALLSNDAGMWRPRPDNLRIWAVHARQQQVAALPGAHPVAVAPARGLCAGIALIWHAGNAV